MIVVVLDHVFSFFAYFTLFRLMGDTTSQLSVNWSRGVVIC
jgi:hypothetical protein